MGKPGVGEERKTTAAGAAAVSFTISENLATFALRAKDIFAEQRPAQELFNLWITWYLIECVHVHSVLLCDNCFLLPKL